MLAGKRFTCTGDVGDFSASGRGGCSLRNRADAGGAFPAALQVGGPS
jgi:hypothetical protein